MAAADFAAAADAVQGVMPCSDGERHVLLVAASIADGIPPPAHPGCQAQPPGEHPGPAVPGLRRYRGRCRQRGSGHDSPRAGIIAEFAARAPDPDSGRLNRRYMTSLAAAPALLGWGEPGHAQARAAAEAGRQWGLPADHPAADGYED